MSYHENIMWYVVHTLGIDRALIVAACMEWSAYTLNVDVFIITGGMIIRFVQICRHATKTHAYLFTPSKQIYRSHTTIRAFKIKIIISTIRKF